MADLLTHPDVNNLVLIGAYRDNEVAAAHPLMRKLDAMHQAGATLQNIVLAPLTRYDLEQLIAEFPFAVNRDMRAHWRDWSRKRPPAIRFLPFNSYLTCSKRDCSASITSRDSGIGTSIAFTPRVIPTMSWTLWWGS